MKRKKKHSFRLSELRFTRMQMVIVLFLLLGGVLFLVQRNVPYQAQESLLEPYEAVPAAAKPAEQDPECMIIWQDDTNGKNGRELMEAVLGQMKIPYDTCKAGEVKERDLEAFETIVLSVTDYSLLDEGLLQILDRVEKGAGLLVLCPPEKNGSLQAVSEKLGIRQIGNQYHTVSGIHFAENFMLGSQLEDFVITDPYESSLQVILEPECEILVQSDDDRAVPLIWRTKLGEGTVVFDNLGFLEKAYRGFYAASYSLLQEVCVYPVINGSVFYIDDFPSPVPGGDSEYIQRDYGMNISDFYTQIWWRDVYNLAEQYGIRYTGLVIEQYSDQVEPPFTANKDIQRYRYFGNMLLDQGGEIGYHGYNHMPLCLMGFDYKGEYDAYRLWESYEDMTAALTELRRFCETLYPNEKLQVYVPPSNILSREGREALKESTDICAIASIYLPADDGVAYDQEFEVGEDGIIETPRVISGYILNDYMKLAAFSELNFHYVNSHFQHPDDTLDKDRGAALGWEEMFGRLSDYAKWLFEAAPDIRSLTGTEMAAAVQIYDDLQVQRERTETGIRLKLGGFQEEAWLMVRVNEGTIGKVTGARPQKLLDDLYLLQATDSEINIEIS